MNHCSASRSTGALVAGQDLGAELVDPGDVGAVAQGAVEEGALLGRCRGVELAAPGLLGADDRGQLAEVAGAELPGREATV